VKVVLALAARLLVPGAEILSTLTLLAAALAGGRDVKKARELLDAGDSAAAIELVGAGPGVTYLESTEPVVRYVGESEGRFEGFTVRYLGEAEEPSILVFNASPLIVNNEITQATLAGVEVQSGANPTLFSNHIHSNTGTGVLVHADGRALLTANTIEQNGRNLVVHHPGVEVRENGRATIQFNQILLNGGSGIFVQDEAQADIVANTVIGNGLHGVNAKEEASITLASNTILWNTQAGVWVRSNVVSTMKSNVISRNLLGLAVSRDPRTDADVPIPQENNIFLGNARDLSGGGLSPSDLAVVGQVFDNQQFGSMLQLLDLIGESVTALRADFSDNQRQILIALVQNIELISASVYQSAGLVEEAETRYRMVIRLDLNSDAAAQAREALEALGG